MALWYKYRFQTKLGDKIIYASSEVKARERLKKWFKIDDAKFLSRSGW